MSMFDDFRMEKPVYRCPKCEKEFNSFQTKAFDCLMSTFRLTESGKLEILQYELVRSEPTAENVLGFPMLEQRNKHWVAIPDYTGVVYIYDSCCNYWLDLKLTFIHGELESAIPEFTKRD